MLRRVFFLLLTAGGVACTETPCREEGPSVSVEVVADEVHRATSIREIDVRLEYQDRALVRTFQLEDELFDGKASFEIPLVPAPTGDFMLEVEVEARASGMRLVERVEAEGNASGCNRVQIDLTDSVPPTPRPDAGVDAGVDAGTPDTGTPTPDAGPEDLGFDAGEPDLGQPEVCGDGIVTTAEACDDGNETEGDGCSACVIDPNFGCSGSPSRCEIWWSVDYAYRQRVSVAVGPNSPFNGYQFYTLRVQGLDTARLIDEGRLAGDCSDLRVVYAGNAQDAAAALPRNIVRCGANDTELHFASPVDLPADALVDQFFVYFGGPAAPTEEAVQTRNVYLFYDDASVDRGGRYVRGRIDNWYDAWDNSLSWNSNGYYTYNSPNDTVSGYRRGVDERDVYVEAEFYHTGCAPQNMVTGLVVRGIIASGSTITESSDHYYFSGRLDQPGCGEGYVQDGDIARGHWQTTIVDATKPPQLVPNVWRKHALAAVGGTTTELMAWDADASWSSPGFPDRDPYARGTDPQAASSPGFAAFMTTQDMGRVRRFLVRRFTEPEPRATLGPEERLP